MCGCKTSRHKSLGRSRLIVLLLILNKISFSPQKKAESRPGHFVPLGRAEILGSHTPSARAPPTLPSAAALHESGHLRRPPSRLSVPQCPPHPRCTSAHLRRGEFFDLSLFVFSGASFDLDLFFTVVDELGCEQLLSFAKTIIVIIRMIIVCGLVWKSV
jgi:hypothetical protein